MEETDVKERNIENAKRDRKEGGEGRGVKAGRSKRKRKRKAARRKRKE